MINRGALAEQFIGQHLLHASPSWIKPELYYWTRHKKGSSSEVDYIICTGPDVIPVEVKAGKTGTLRSLHTFAALKGTKLAVRFNADRPSLTEIETEISNIGIARYLLISLPLYMVEQTHRLLELGLGRVQEYIPKDRDS
jgi:predicted AAA+ superfamily ATPase